MKSRLSTFLAALACAALSLSSLHAQEKTEEIDLWVLILDYYYEEPVQQGLKAEVLNKDSSLLKELSVGDGDYNSKPTTFAIGSLPACDGEYIVRLSHPEYEEYCFPLKVKYHRRMGSLRPPTVFMKRKSSIRPLDETQLGEATVTATKIKMVMNGDTLVYNADAFQMAKGSMLDALIERLPGVVLGENGVITVNGRPISSLLVNGKDFFRGNPAIALENLPSYMVNKVKVYEQESIIDKIKRGNRPRQKGADDLPLVMDVTLKKEYSIGWIANAEGGYGTDDRYLGRIFALRFTPRSRFALFGNVNNTNDTRRPGRQGDWSPTWQPQGLQNSKTAGVEYTLDNRKIGFDLTSNADFSHTDNMVHSRTASTSFLSGAQTFGQSESLADACNTSFTTTHAIKLDREKTYHKFNADFTYNKRRDWTSSRSATFSEDPYSHVSSGLLDSVFSVDNSSLLRAIALNRYSQETRANSESWSVDIPYFLMLKIPAYLGDLIVVTADFKYDWSKNRTFDRYSLDYPSSASADVDFRNRYSTKPSRGYSYNASVDYSYTFPIAMLGVTYKYDQSYRSGGYELYRLDSLDGWGAGTTYALGELPSNTAELLRTLDAANSQHAETWKKNHSVTLDIERNRRDGVRKWPYKFEAHLELSVRPDRLRYSQDELYTDRRRRNVFFAPRMMYQQGYNHANGHITWAQLNYTHTATAPDFLYSVQESDANPLSIRLSNPDLKNTHRDNFSFSITENGENWKELYRLTLNYTVTRNAVALGSTYNPETGGYTLRPENVNGNWQAGGTFHVSRQFGKQKRFVFSTATNSTFYHNVDLISVENADDSPRSTVRTLYAGETLRLDYGAEKWSLAGKARVNWTHARSAREGFTTINAWDYDIGLAARVQLPWDMELSTDFGLYSRRGYEDSSMNTDDWIWNARLAKSILNGNLTFILDGFDILGQLSTVNRTLNAQGRVETWYNSIPRYAMLHIIYKLNIEPKKK
ncbi:MAG: hypothetical protein Q4E59_03595 [Bacteroidales bacterium]|nr:hypothetical protein [Bacteroidales bacterium]